MICSACGKETTEGAAFCEHCGIRMQGQPAAPAPPMAAWPAPPAPVVTPPAPVAPPGGSLVASMSMGEKTSGAGACAAVVGFFMPWISVATEGAQGATQTSASGMDLAKSVGAVYLILLIALAAGALCYFSSKAEPAKKLMYAGYLVLLGALCGPANLLALLFVSKVQAVAGFGLWLFSLGYTAIAAGGLITIQGFSKRMY
jgi:hypothetical protein